MRHLSSAVGKAAIFLVVIINQINQINSFGLNVNNHNLTRFSSQSLFAKPKAKFDLDAIEALEAELDWQEKNKANADGEGIGKEEEEDWFDIESDHDDVKIFEVSAELKNKRIDAVLSAMEPDMSRSQCGSLITSGMVGILSPSEKKQGRKPTVCIRKSEKLPEGTQLYVKHLEEESPTEIVAQDLPLDVLYEDEHMIVLNKAAGMVVHPAVGNWQGTVVNALAYYLAHKSPFGSGEFIESDGKVKADQADGVDAVGANGEVVSFRPGIVHRLDKGTTGILVVAKTRDSLSALSAAFAAREVKKTYIAVTVGNPGKRIVIDKPIGRHPIHRQRMRVVPDPSKMNSSGMTVKERNDFGVGKSAAQRGRKALSFVDTLAFDGKLGVAQVRIETGRTHQIRVHLQDRTTPVYGDDVYGFADWNKRLVKSQGVQRPLLHAFKLELTHPVTGKKMIFRAPMAEDMIKVAIGTWPQGPTEREDIFELQEVEIIEE
mmetsp:Transcript_24826/g.36701  ORF Transcript_24826/g.36701 Transcript_24826/m.36701 type:complete len:489 (-) Transcript_24826:75-1541(-)